MEFYFLFSVGVGVFFFALILKIWHQLVMILLLSVYAREKSVFFKNKSVNCERFQHLFGNQNLHSCISSNSQRKYMFKATITCEDLFFLRLNIQKICIWIAGGS